MNHFDGAERIGRDAWTALVAHYGGCELHVPPTIHTSGAKELVQQIGKQAAEKLIAYAGGDRLYIAAGWEHVLAARYGRITAMHDKGKTPSEIAREFRFVGAYTERNIRMILSGRFEELRRTLGDSYQPDLPGI